jgi:hypothetical protein
MLLQKPFRPFDGTSPDMSLTVALGDPKSSINAFFDEHLPHHELLTRAWAKTLQRRSWTKSLPASRAPHLIGAAIEIRLGFDLAHILRTANSLLPSP